MIIRQPEIVEIYKALAKKYKLSYDQVMEIVELRFEFLRDKMTKTNVLQNDFLAIRLHKFALFHVPIKSQKRFYIINKNTELKRQRELNLNNQQNEGE